MISIVVSLSLPWSDLRRVVCGVVQSAGKTGKKRMQEANSDTRFKKGQQDADFFKKLHKVCCCCADTLPKQVCAFKHTPLISFIPPPFPPILLVL